MEIIRREVFVVMVDISQWNRKEKDISEYMHLGFNTLAKAKEAALNNVQYSSLYDDEAEWEEIWRTNDPYFGDYIRKWILSNSGLARTVMIERVIMGEEF